jgi:two-component system, OmpR family, sensor histidine kinase KdpD
MHHAPDERPADTTRARGRLQVLLGIAPGVGKTYRMLADGRQRAAEGRDVVVGFVDPDAPARTLAMLAGLEVIPARRLEHRELVVEELDAPAIIDRHPSVVLIDDLGHRNAPGTGRQHRWQDVEEFRDLGIDVVSTVDIGQIEPVAEAAETITGAPILDRVPGRVIDGVDEIELVDIGAAELRTRIVRGELYPADRARSMLAGFYAETSLVALRELALRFLARRLDDQLEHGLAGDYAVPRATSTERVLVVLDDRAVTRQAVRRAAILAGTARATLAAVVIETPGAESRSREQANRLVDNTRYAVDLGAEVVRYAASDLVEGLEHVARSRRITHLFMPHRSRTGVFRWAHSSLPEVLAERLPELEIHIVSEPATEQTGLQS